MDHTCIGTVADPETCVICDSRDSETVTVSWTALRVGRPIRMRANPESIEMANDDDGLHLASIPLPERMSTRISLARLILGASFDLDAQPDHPEPVDPSEVRVGDVVEVEADDGMVRGEVEEIDLDASGAPLLIAAIGRTIRPIIYSATVRVLRRAEPEPDPAAVEALVGIVHDVNNSFESTPLTKSATNRFVRELIRRGVEVPDA